MTDFRQCETFEKVFELVFPCRLARADNHVNYYACGYCCDLILC